MARVERAILSLGGIARVHLYRYGLPIWEDVLPKVPDEELLEAARRIAAAMDAPG